MTPRWQTASPWKDSFEVELGDAPAPEEPAGAPTALARVGQDRHAARTGHSSSSSRASTKALLLAGQEPALENVDPEMRASAPSEPDVLPPSKPIDLGLGPDGWQRWMTAPAPGEAPRAASRPARNRYQVFRPAPASTTGGLQEGLDASERARGLGPEGRVLSALHKAAHAPAAPESGVARFEVTVRRTGAVEVTLGAATAAREQWTQVAGHIASDLRRSPPRVPPPHEGFKYVVEIVAEQALPNGTKAKALKKPHADAPLKFQSTQASVEQTNRENPTLVNPTPDDIALKLDTPGVYVAQTNKACDYRAGLGVIAPGYGQGFAAGPTIQGACDPSNLGAKSQRVVRARVIAQSLF